MNRTLRPLVLLLAVQLLNACGWNPIAFITGGDDDEVKPAKLVSIEEEVRLRRLWNVNIGNGQGKKYNRLKSAIEGDTLRAEAKVFSISHKKADIDVDIYCNHEMEPFYRMRGTVYRSSKEHQIED